MKNRYVERELAGEITQKYEYLQQEDPSQVRMKCRQAVRREIEKNSQIHSYRIEESKKGIPFSVPRNRHKSGIHKGIQNIENAFLWGISHFDPETVDEALIKGIAGRISPELYHSDNARYRDTRARITGARVIPPDTYKLTTREMPNFVASLKERLECPKIVNKVESAIFAHLGIARIHPFLDGNGRTARILQDVILNHYDIPAPIIEAGERMIYYDLLERAVIEMVELEASGETPGITPGEGMFYDFIAGKINVSLDRILASCQNHSGH
ncbi:MAG: Fic family protein [Candidatus Nanoarchaeia archaeon]|nr:Fic family protein [Candidatus Nanoarchaeia archaeon]